MPKDEHYLEEFKCPLEELHSLEEPYSLKEIYKSAGGSENFRKCLDELRRGYFGDNSSFIQWWYAPNIRMDASPEQFCKEGKQSELECILMDIFTGAHGG